MSKFIEMVFVGYPRIGYGDNTPKYQQEIVNTDTIERISKKIDNDTLKEVKTEIMFRNDTKWRYCANSYEELLEILTEHEETRIP